MKQLDILRLHHYISGHTKREEELQFPRRPGYGKIGRPINLRTNFFALTLPRNDFIYHYDVTITPETVKAVHREVMELLYKKYAGEAFGKARPAFDGSRNLYTMVDLPVGRDGVCILQVAGIVLMLIPIIC